VLYTIVRILENVSSDVINFAINDCTVSDGANDLSCVAVILSAV
jgi:hypothetical protein